MPSGFRADTESWLREYEEAKTLAQEIVQLVQERNVHHANGGPEASRKTAAARRKIGTLGTLIEKLLKALDAPQCSELSEAERDRRRDLLYDLRNRREQMQYSLKRTQGQADRDALLGGASSSQTNGGGGPRETEQTAELDAQGLLQLQKATMAEQDQVLGHMEKTVLSTKHIALAIGEEVDLHTRLLEDLEDDVDVSNTRLRAATARIKHILASSSHCRGGCLLFVLVVTLVVVTIIGFKLNRLFGG